MWRLRVLKMPPGSLLVLRVPEPVHEKQVRTVRGILDRMGRHDVGVMVLPEDARARVFGKRVRKCFDG